MADRIKGITVEIGGDVSGLSKALKGVNTEIKSTQKELKDVERLLKLDPSNTELLRQKQQLLATQTETTAKKFAELKKASESVKPDDAKYQQWQTAFAGITKNVNATETQLVSLEKQQKAYAAQGIAPDSAPMVELGKQIAATKERLAELDAQSKTTFEELGRPISTEQYRALQRETIAAGQAAEEAEKAYNSFSPTLTSVSSSARSASDALGKMADATKLASAAAAGVLGASAKVAMDFESAISQIAATMGKTVDDLEIQQLKAFAEEMGRTTAFSAAEAASGLNILAMAGLDANQQMATLPAVLDLAAAGSLSLDTAAKYVTGSIKGFGGSMEDASKYADLIAKGATQAATDVDMLGAAMSASAATAKSYGQDADMTTVALLRLAEQNLTGTEAATSLNRAIADLYTPTDAAKKALDSLGVSAYDMTGQARDVNDVVDQLNASLLGMSEEQKNATLNTIFTTNGLSAFNKMTSSTTETVDRFRDAVRGAGGSASEQAATQLDNFAGRVTLLKSALEGAAIQIGEQLLPYLEKIVAIVQKAVDWFSSLDKGQQSMIVTILLMVAALSPVAGILSAVLGAVANLSLALPLLSSGLSAATGAFGAFSAALIANPIGLVIAAIVALVAALAIFGDDIKAVLKSVDEYLQNVFATDFSETWGVLGDILNGFLATAKDAWDGFKSLLTGLIDFVQALFHGDWKKAWDSAVEVVRSALELMTLVFKAPINGILSLINAVITGVNALISGLNGIKIDVPEWLPGIGGKSFGFNLPEISKIPYLASGGILSSGSAVVGEAGPELLTMAGGRAVVQPLTATLDPAGLSDALSGLGGGNVNVVVNFEGNLSQLGRVLQPVITAETARRGGTFGRR